MIVKIIVKKHDVDEVVDVYFADEDDLLFIPETAISYCASQIASQIPQDVSYECEMYSEYGADLLATAKVTPKNEYDVEIIIK